MFDVVDIMFASSHQDVRRSYSDQSYNRQTVGVHSIAYSDIIQVLVAL